MQDLKLKSVYNYTHTKFSSIHLTVIGFLMLIDEYHSWSLQLIKLKHIKFGNDPLPIVVSCVLTVLWFCFLEICK